MDKGKVPEVNRASRATMTALQEDGWEVHAALRSCGQRDWLGLPLAVLQERDGIPRRGRGERDAAANDVARSEAFPIFLEASSAGEKALPAISDSLNSSIILSLKHDCFLLHFKNHRAYPFPILDGRRLLTSPSDRSVRGKMN